MRDGRLDPQGEEWQFQGDWTGGGDLEDNVHPPEPPAHGRNHFS